MGELKMIWSVMPAFAVVASLLARGPLLLVDDTRMPRVQVSWTKSDGTKSTLQARLPYASPEDHVPLGENLEVFAGLGGTRLTKGAGHPEGAIVRVGLLKADPNGLFFTDIAHGSSITFDLTNVAFNQPARPDFDSLLQRLEYKVDDVLACGLTIDQTEMFNLADSDDTMGGALLPSQVRFACFNGADAGGADAAFSVEADGTLSIHAEIPYSLLRHRGDPWSLVVPGTFFEPFRFDIEFEVLPAAVAEAEGVKLVSDPTPR